LIVSGILDESEAKERTPEEIGKIVSKHFTTRTLTREDLVAIIGHIIMVNNGMDTPDDIDHLGNRRVSTVGELLQNQVRIGLLRLERIVRERMSIIMSEDAYEMRRLFLALGSHFVGMGIMRDRDDIFYMHFGEVRAAVGGDIAVAEIREKISRRKRKMMFDAAIEPMAEPVSTFVQQVGRFDIRVSAAYCFKSLRVLFQISL